MHDLAAEEIEPCPECGEIHNGECEPAGAWFLALTPEEQDAFIRESLEKLYGPR